MKIEILTKNYDVSEKLREVLTRKITKLDRYFEEDSVIKIYLKKEGNGNYKMEITVEYKGNFIKADVSGENFYDNIDVVLPKIEKQIFKHRTKLENKLKRNAYVDFNPNDYGDILKPQVVKSKKFYLKPMSVDDAIEELDLLNHSFYVFLEASSNEIRVVYRRDDGNIGIIIPQIM